MPHRFRGNWADGGRSGLGHVVVILPVANAVVFRLPGNRRAAWVGGQPAVLPREHEAPARVSLCGSGGGRFPDLIRPKALWPNKLPNWLSPRFGKELGQSAAGTNF
jgi:hypothetical protein